MAFRHTSLGLPAWISNVWERRVRIGESLYELRRCREEVVMRHLVHRAVLCTVASE